MNSARVVALESTTVPCAAGRVILSLGRAPQVRVCRVEWNLGSGNGIYDTALNATEIASSFATGPEVPNPINLQTVYFEDFETGYSNGDPVTNKPEWTVVDSPGVLGGGTAAGLPDGHGLVLGGFVDTTENKVSFGDVTADKVYFSFDLYQTTDHTRGLTFDLVDGPQDAVDTVYAI